MSRPLADRAQVLVVALWLAVAAAILDAYAHANRISVVQDAINAQETLEGVPVRVDPDLVDRADLYVTLGLVAMGATALLVLAAWIWWRRAVAGDLRAARARGLAAGAGGALLVGLVLLGVGARDEDVLADQRLPDGLSMGADALIVLAAILAIGVVRRRTDATLRR